LAIATPAARIGSVTHVVADFPNRESVAPALPNEVAHAAAADLVFAVADERAASYGFASPRMMTSS